MSIVIAVPGASPILRPRKNEETRVDANGFDVLGIGNAIVDVLAQTDDRFLAEHGLVKGTMALIDESRAEALYAAMGPGIEASGGSVANSIAGLAGAGARTAFIGRIKNDSLGGIFAHDIRALGVAFDTPRAEAGPATARCLVLVTADAQRTMGTYLGASVDLGPDEVAEAVVRAARITYLEGYLWDQPPAKAAFRKAAQVAHEAGREVALSLSDPFCVERHRDDFLRLVENEVDILFANEAEITSLFQTDDFDAAAAAVRGRCRIAALTRSEKGSIVISGEATHAISAAPAARVVDTTGAGDQYAAGFLYGLVRGRDLAECGRLGSLAAAEVIGHFGARPETALSRLTGPRAG